MTQIKAVIFGAIGVVAETAEFHRQAFNAAFKEAGLDWKWSVVAYKELLKTPDGEERIRSFRDGDASRAAVTDEMIKDLYAAKETSFSDLIGRSKLAPRPGVKELIDACTAADVLIAWCSSSRSQHVAALKRVLAKQLPFKDFASIVTADQISAEKPAPDAYLRCLKDLGLTAAEVVAIEDTPANVAAAKAAGILTVATPSDATAGQDFSAADLVVTSLLSVTLESLQELADGPRVAAVSGENAG